MQDDQVEQTDEAVEEETSEDTTTETEGAADDNAAEGPSGEEFETAAAVDMSTAGSSGSTVLAEPEVPDDADEKITAAQDHMNTLDLDKERNAAEHAQKEH